MTQKPQILATSTMVLILIIVVIVLAIPDIIGFFTQPEPYTTNIMLDDGTKIQCVILDHNDSSGIDCFLDDTP